MSILSGSKAFHAFGAPDSDTKPSRPYERPTGSVRVILNFEERVFQRTGMMAEKACLLIPTSQHPLVGGTCNIPNLPD